MKKILLQSTAFLLFFPSFLLCQSPDFQFPIEGEEGKDFFIVNYVDHAFDTGAIRDYRCGTKTYDGHQGTDFTLRSFAQMDSGVAVLAAADGIVFFALDSLFDRNKESVGSEDSATGSGSFIPEAGTATTPTFEQVRRS